MIEFFRKPILPCWDNILRPSAEELYFRRLAKSLNDRRLSGASLVPFHDDALEVFRILPIDDVKIAIIGQDPYPSVESATGIPFGVPKGGKMPPALINICNEVERNLNEPRNTDKCAQILSAIENDKDSPYFPMPYKKGMAMMQELFNEDESRPKTVLNRTNMTLEGWVRQGVLLLNSIMTTEDGIIGAHENLGWEQFTDNVVFALASAGKPMVFLLWGSMAEQKKKIIEQFGGTLCIHHIFTATHPSSLSFNRGPLANRFEGCGHFTRANNQLLIRGFTQIDWTKTGV